MVQTTLKVNGMMCGMCESHINDVVRKTAQVEKVTSSHTKGETVIVSAQPLDIEALKDFSDAEGLKLYDVEVKAISAAIKRELKDRDVIPGVSVKPGTPKPFAEAIMRNLDESRKGN